MNDDTVDQLRSDGEEVRPRDVITGAGCGDVHLVAPLDESFGNSSAVLFCSTCYGDPVTLDDKKNAHAFTRSGPSHDSHVEGVGRGSGGGAHEIWMMNLDEFESRLLREESDEVRV